MAAVTQMGAGFGSTVWEGREKQNRPAESQKTQRGPSANQAEGEHVLRQSEMNSKKGLKGGRVF